MWAEAEKSVQNALKPSPLQTGAVKSQPTATKTTTTTTTVASKPTTTASKVVTSTSTNNANKSDMGRFSNYKTVMCKNWMRDKRCPMAEYCTFAHGKGDLRPIPRVQVRGASFCCFFWSAITFLKIDKTVTICCYT